MHSIFSPAGGVGYHLRALRYKALWEPFVCGIAEALNNWEVPKAKLLLIGPSGGYTLPKHWIQSFELVYAVEPDPLARRVFAMRHRPALWLNDRWLSNTNPFDDIHGLRALIQKVDAPIIFCNLFGQIPLLYKSKIIQDEAKYLKWQKSVSQLLSSSRFFSYHDLYSETFDPTNGDQRILVDHLTSNMFDGFHRRTVSWQLTPKIRHQIELVNLP